MPTDTWHAGYESLQARVRGLPERMRGALAAAARPLGWTLDPSTGFVVTGVGSSEAHARLIVSLLREQLGLRARFAPLGAWLDGTPGRRGHDVLVVVSQGLSPNACMALHECDQWARVVLLTATTVAGARGAGRHDTADVLAALGRAGVEARTFPAGEDEYGTLVRVVGPMIGYLMAMRFVEAVAEALGRVAPVTPAALAAVPAVLEAVPAAVDTLLAKRPDLVERLAGPLAFVAAGDYGALLDNMRYKVLEGMLCPLPPIYDVLHLAHGPFQQFHDRPMTLLALTRPERPGERRMLDRLEDMLVGDRHVLVRLAATLPGPLAVFEHEAILNELMLRHIAASGIDQCNWPGRGADAPLYDVRGGAPETHERPTSPSDDAPRPSSVRPSEQRLECLTWPEAARLLASRAMTAVLPLGSTEQHGGHLPFATDTRIATALGLRFCAQVSEALLLPTLPLGCASEHMAFQGTLDLRAETLAQTLVDIVRSLAAHRFARAFIFSAHGGNVAALANVLPELRRAGAPMVITAHTDLTRLSALWHETSGTYGVPPEVSGHHAGEYETSIVRALWPEALRDAALAPGYVAPVADAQALFYPSLADAAPSGVVGDPRASDGVRGARYLEAWAGLLVSTYQLEKNKPYTTGK